MRNRQQFSVSLGTMGSREYVKDAWEESKYIKPLEITVSFRVPLVIKKGEEPKKYDFFQDTFLTMCKLTGENGIWWIGSGENREGMMMRQLQRKRRKVKMKEIEVDFDREALIDEATVEGESWSWEKFYDAEEDAQGSP
ncbi:hypothetical protein Dimus_006182 [Dionaea muscipula]